MGDIEDAMDEDSFTEAEGEYVYSDSKSQLKMLAISAGRQFFCSFSVMIFPFLAHIITIIPTENPPLLVRRLYTRKEKREFEIQLDRHIMISSVIGLVIGGILVYFIGRKYTVIVANLSHIVVLSHSYLSGIEEEFTYNMSMAHNLVKEIGYVAFMMYLAEITSPIFRAFFLGLYHFNGAVMGDYLNFEREIIIVYELLRSYLLITIFSFAFALFIPETPFWLTLKNNAEKAEETFRWIRANDPEDMSEFDQMLATAENIIEGKRIIKYLFSRTFAVGVILSSFIVICGVYPCQLMELVIHDLYVPKYYKYTDSYERDNLLRETFDVINEPRSNRFVNSIYGHLIFLTFNFMLNRKVLYFVSYISGLFVVLIVRLHSETFSTLMDISTYCSMTPAMGIIPLVQILPVEIYPTALREVGVIITAVLNRVFNYSFDHFYEPADKHFPRDWLPRTFTLICFYISLLGILFLLLFMPETMNTNIYELNKLEIISLPAEAQKEDTEVEGESSAEEL